VPLRVHRFLASTKYTVEDAAQLNL
jgi:hypothetical protein